MVSFQCASKIPFYKICRLYYRDRDDGLSQMRLGIKPMERQLGQLSHARSCPLSHLESHTDVRKLSLRQDSSCMLLRPSILSEPVTRVEHMSQRSEPHFPHESHYVRLWTG